MIVGEVVPWAPGIPEPEVCRERVATLSPGEREILELMALGYAPKQVALMRGATIHTVRNQLSFALAKLNVIGHYQGLAVLHRAQSSSAPWNPWVNMRRASV